MCIFKEFTNVCSDEILVKGGEGREEEDNKIVFEKSCTNCKN